MTAASKWQLAAFLLACSLAGCRETPSAPSTGDGLSETSDSANYTFRHAAGDAVDIDRQEAFHAWAVPRLGIEVGRRIEFRKYRDRSHMQKLTGQATNGWADPPAFTAHSIWPWDPHEVLHVMTALWGRPSDFFNEGLAVALAVDPQAGRFEPTWASRPLDAWVRQFRTEGQLPRLETMVESSDFRRQAESRGYPIAGSFVRFLIGVHGLEPLKTLFRASSANDRIETIRRRFEEAFGEPLTAAEAAWLAGL